MHAIYSTHARHNTLHHNYTHDTQIDQDANTLRQASLCAHCTHVYAHMEYNTSTRARFHMRFYVCAVILLKRHDDTVCLCVCIMRYRNILCILVYSYANRLSASIYLVYAWMMLYVHARNESQ